MFFVYVHNRIRNIKLLFILIIERKKKCERSQLWSIDWCGERPFGHQFSHHIFCKHISN